VVSQTTAVFVEEWEVPLALIRPPAKPSSKTDVVFYRNINVTALRERITKNWASTKMCRAVMKPALFRSSGNFL